jgi:hypothetical protein
MDTFVIKYVITGQEDGRWIIQAFDRNDKPISSRIECSTPDDAWRIWLLLNGYSYVEPVEIAARRELTQILQEKAS